MYNMGPLSDFFQKKSLKYKFETKNTLHENKTNE